MSRLRVESPMCSSYRSFVTMRFFSGTCQFCQALKRWKYSQGCQGPASHNMLDVYSLLTVEMAHFLFLCAQVQDAFEHLLELVTYQQHAAKALQLQPPPGCTAEDATAFLQSTAVAVLGMAPGRKGRYSPLAALLPRVSGRWLLQQQPQLVQQGLRAMQDDMVANTATSFFKALLVQLRQEVDSNISSASSRSSSSSSKGQGSAAAAPAVADGQSEVLAVTSGSNVDQLTSWCSWWLDHVLHVLWGADERLRTYVANHALPVVLQLEPQLLPVMLGQILHATAAREVNATAALVVVLKAARQLLLIGDLDELEGLLDQQQQQQLLVGSSIAGHGGGSSSSRVLGVTSKELLQSAVSSVSEALRVETLELICVNPR